MGRIRRAPRSLVIGIAATAAIGVLAVVSANAVVLVKGSGGIHENPADLDPAEVAIVLGAQVKPDGTMSSMLADRVRQGVALWRAGKVKRILVSGDHGSWSYDEPTTMRRAMISSGVPREAIFTDHAGFNTRASMQRARDIFEIHDAIVVTQGFHMKRSLFLARQAGIETQGLTADLHPYGGQGLKSSGREIASRLKAVLESLTSSRVTGGPKVPITGPARESWGPAAPPGTPAAGVPSSDVS